MVYQKLVIILVISELEKKNGIILMIRKLVGLIYKKWEKKLMEALRRILLVMIKRRKKMHICCFMRKFSKVKMSKPFLLLS